MNASIETQVAHYLRTGEHDQLFPAWSGSDVLDRIRRGDAHLREALIAEVRHRMQGRTAPSVPEGVGLIELARARIEPMVRGLFPAREHDIVLAILERAIVFLTPHNIEALLAETSSPGSAWTFANLYLNGAGAELLAEDAPRLVGVSEETTCYVSPAYFHENEPFADFIVHEAAHVFHNCKRKTVGLPSTRWREWLLEIEFRKRETFAYACEAYTCILERGNKPAERRRALDELANGSMPPDERVDAGEYLDILTEAVAARNGWRRILERCAPERRLRGRALSASGG
ncbi:hypothetical protein [Sorangium sp. So ce1153]|uniref:hypothetical protein n=1 Tax=Sorangium sp. So ce1153 TaxID=3133333 RepID=UPI003F6486F3